MPEAGPQAATSSGLMVWPTQARAAGTDDTTSHPAPDSRILAARMASTSGLSGGDMTEPTGGACRAGSGFMRGDLQDTMSSPPCRVGAISRITFLKHLITQHWLLRSCVTVG